MTRTHPRAWLNPPHHTNHRYHHHHQNKKRSKALKVFLEDRRALEPWEIDELRMANAEAIPDVAAFHELVLALKEAFPAGAAPYREFIQVRACVRACLCAQIESSGWVDDGRVD